MDCVVVLVEREVEDLLEGRRKSSRTGRAEVSFELNIPSFLPLNFSSSLLPSLSLPSPRSFTSPKSIHHSPSRSHYTSKKRSRVGPKSLKDRQRESSRLP